MGEWKASFCSDMPERNALRTAKNYDCLYGDLRKPGGTGRN